MSFGLAVRKKAPSVTFTLALRFSLVLALAVLSLAVLFTFALKRYIYNSQSRELKDSAEELALALKTNAQPEQKEKIPYYITYAVYQKESQEILETNDPFLPLLEATKGKTKKFVSKNYFIDGDLRILYFAMEEESDEYGSLVIQTALNLDTDSSSLLLRGIPVIVLLAFLPVLFVSFLTALLIAKRSLAPVVKMTEAAKKISSTNLGELLPLKQKDSSAENISTGNLDELGKLAVTFNDLFVRLKKDFDRERGFTSDVSHELKTPLAVVHSYAEGLQENIAAEKREAYLETILAESERMDAMVLEMLDLSRLEAGRVKLSQDETDLSALTAATVEKLQPLADRRGLDFTVTAPGTLPVTADEARIAQVIENLVSNAVRYAKENTAVQIMMDRRAGKVSFSIENETEKPLSSEEISRVWETFYRADKARSEKGTGLGLAIAKNIVELHGGSVQATNTKTGVRFSFTLPE